MPGGILNAADWTVAGNWSTAGVPTSNDDAIMSDALGANVPGTDQGGVDLDLLKLPKGFKYSLGSEATPLIAAADLITHFGTGGLYFDCSANGTGLKTDIVDICCGAAGVPVQLGSESGDAGDYDLIRIARGNVLLKGGIQFGAAGIVEVSYVSQLSNDATVVIGNSADTLPTLRMFGGTVTTDNVITNAYVAAGKMTHGTATVTNLYIGAGAEVRYNHTTLTNVIVYSGGRLILDDEANYKTIATTVMYPGAVIQYDEDLTTFTAPIVYVGF